MNWRALVGSLLVGLGYAFSWFLFALDPWITLGATLVFSGLSFRIGFAAGFFGSMLYTAYSFTVLLFGNPLWVSALIGVVAILLLVFNINRSSAVEETME